MDADGTDNIADDLARALEAGVATAPESMVLRGWPLENQEAEVVAHLLVHKSGGTRQQATDRELYLLGEMIERGELDPAARRYFTRMDPAQQPEREGWLFEKREAGKEHAMRTIRVHLWLLDHGNERDDRGHLLRTPPDDELALLYP